jgi:hypothetical protein
VCSSDLQACANAEMDRALRILKISVPDYVADTDASVAKS